jgi:polar amino acid transport system permease protein
VVRLVNAHGESYHALVVDPDKYTDERRARSALTPACSAGDAPAEMPAPPGRADTRLRELAGKPLDVQRRHHLGQWLSGAIVIGFVVWLIKTLAENRLISWSTVGHYLFSLDILHGLLGTLELTAVSMALAIVLGFVLAALGASGNPVLVWFVRGYVWIFRSVPLIVQLLAWYNLALVFPVVAIGVPLTSWHLQSATNTVVTPFMAAILGLGLHEAAYMAEIVRAGIVAVPQGQTDAALSVGLTRWQAIRTVVLPQALRVIVPPTGNQLVGLLKASALVYVIGGVELLTTAQRIYSVNFEVMALLIVASIWYLTVISVLTLAQGVLEGRLDRDRIGGDRAAGPVADPDLAGIDPQL